MYLWLSFYDNQIMLSTHALYSFNVEVPSKIAILAGADSPLKFLYFPSSFLEGFPPSSSFGLSFFFPLFTIVFRLLSFFLLKIRNDEKKTFLLRFSFSFLLVEKKERKKRKRVRSVLGGMMKMMLLGWEQNNQE